MSGKLFIGPMSKNVVDAVLELVSETGLETAFIPSRRQIEYTTGYVNKWSTDSFTKYINKRVPIQRDHSGPGQGLDNYIDSYREDCKCEFNLIHIDPWKQWPGIDHAAVITSLMITDCLEKNPQCRFEVGTEEQIRKYSPEQLDLFLSKLYKILGKEKFSSIEYAVVQSGTIVRALGNTGKFDFKKSKTMCDVVHHYGLKAKEHNSDYLSVDEFKIRAEAGVDTFNIAPELGVIETRFALDNLSGQPKRDFVELCVKSGKWKKWIDEETSEEQIAEICGHYQFSTDEFQIIKDSLPKVFDTQVKSKIKNRITEIINCLL